MPLVLEWNSLEMFNIISSQHNCGQVESFKQQLLEPPLAAWVRPRGVAIPGKLKWVQSECSISVSVFVGQTDSMNPMQLFKKGFKIAESSKQNQKMQLAHFS